MICQPGIKILAEVRSVEAPPWMDRRTVVCWLLCCVWSAAVFWWLAHVMRTHGFPVERCHWLPLRAVLMILQISNQSTNASAGHWEWCSDDVTATARLPPAKSQTLKLQLPPPSSSHRLCLFSEAVRPWSWVPELIHEATSSTLPATDNDFFVSLAQVYFLFLARIYRFALIATRWIPFGVKDFNFTSDSNLRGSEER